MGQGYLVDSNVIIDYAASRLPQKSSDFVENLFNNHFTVSVAVKIEVLGFDDITDKLSAIEQFIDTSIVLPLDESVVKQTILLRRKYKRLKLGDAIFAATATLHDLTLLSRNTKDFIKIDGLEVLNPYDI